MPNTATTETEQPVAHATGSWKVQALIIGLVAWIAAIVYAECLGETSAPNRERSAEQAAQAKKAQPGALK